MSEISSLCVYCGSAPGTDPAFVEAATALGRAMAADGIRLVYGGGNIGLMGTVARAVLDNGGQVTGIIPEFLKTRERMLTDVHDLVVVPDMHTRKRIMFERADAFVALPGGVGTLEELVEQLTWSQLGRHRKPILIADIGGFWRPFLALVDHMRDQGFVRSGFDVTYLVTDRIRDVIPMLREAARRQPADPAAAALVDERF